MILNGKMSDVMSLSFCEIIIQEKAFMNGSRS